MQAVLLAFFGVELKGVDVAFGNSARESNAVILRLACDPFLRDNIGIVRVDVIEE